MKNYGADEVQCDAAESCQLQVGLLMNSVICDFENCGDCTHECILYLYSVVQLVRSFHFAVTVVGCCFSCTLAIVNRILPIVIVTRQICCYF